MSQGRLIVLTLVVWVGGPFVVWGAYRVDPGGDIPGPLPTFMALWWVVASVGLFVWTLVAAARESRPDRTVAPSPSRDIDSLLPADEPSGSGHLPGDVEETAPSAKSAEA